MYLREKWDIMNIIIELSDGTITAVHSEEEITYYLINWDLLGSTDFAKISKTPKETDIIINKRNIDSYVNEIINE